MKLALSIDQVAYIIDHIDVRHLNTMVLPLILAPLLDLGLILFEWDMPHIDCIVIRGCCVCIDINL